MFFFNILALQAVDTQLFGVMTSTLNDEQRNAIQAVINDGILRQQKLGMVLTHFRRFGTKRICDDP